MGLVRDLKLLRAVDKFIDDVKKGKNMVAWIPSFVTLALTIAGLFNAPIQSFISSHPTAGIAIGGIYAVLKGLLPSPVQSASKS